MGQDAIVAKLKSIVDDENDATIPLHNRASVAEPLEAFLSAGNSRRLLTHMINFQEINLSCTKTTVCSLSGASLMIIAIKQVELMTCIISCSADFPQGNSILYKGHTSCDKQNETAPYVKN